MNQAEVREYNLKKCNERLKVNQLKLPLLLKRIKELEKEKDDLLQQILEDIWSIELEHGDQKANRLVKGGDIKSE